VETGQTAAPPTIIKIIVIRGKPTLNIPGVGQNIFSGGLAFTLGEKIVTIHNIIN
jgi:hypothetical protein